MGKSIKEIKSLIEKELTDFATENEINNLSIDVTIQKMHVKNMMGGILGVSYKAETEIKIN